ncbi:hypothetical protein FJ944_26060 [Mesorhizobium sp. B2-4-11]|nr:hypothetical protein FJ944_26060 [Mesorhizobium sp. B2-4-11]
MLPIFVIDNTDEFDPAYKERVFQYFQSASRSAKHCLLIFPVTDKSAWAFSKTDIYKIYSSKSFFLPTPSPREVFRRRIDYLKEKINAQASGKIRAEYFTSQGIRVKISDLQAFASVVENIFVDQDYTAKRLGELANYNMRVTLNLSRRIITSAVTKVDDIIKAFLSGHVLTPSVDQFMNALLKGDYSSYKRGDAHEIFPIFEVNSEIRQSPLTNMRILSLLLEAHVHATEDKQRYLSIYSIYRYFDLIGYTEMAIERSLMELLSANLIERYDLSKKDFSQDQLLAVSYSGMAHLDLAYSNPTYFEQMALTTWITDADRAAQIAGAYKSAEETGARMERVRNLFAEYLVQEDQKFCVIPATGEFALQAKLQGDIARQWRGKEQPVVSEPTMGAVVDGVIAIVDRYDRDRGFGFVEVPEMRDDAFLHARVLESGGFEDVWDGDRLLCEISRNAKGLYVSKVYSFEAAKREILSGQIVRLFPDRQYGFVDMPEFGSNAFFHLSVVPADRRSALAEGKWLTYEAVSDLSGKWQVRRVLDDAPHSL